MYRTTRIALAAALLLVAATACRKKTEPAPAPAPVPTTTAPTDDADARRRADSIAAAEAAARRAAAEREAAIAAARNALTATIYFDYDASDITEQSRAALESKVPVLSANPSVRLRISGHTDNRGSDEYNLALGQRRAAAAKRYLTDRGIDASRIDIVSYGEERPSQEGEDEGAWSRNRRAEFEIVAGADAIAPPTR